MKIAIVGTGYVGLVAGACFSETGNNVICVDVDEKKIEDLKKSIIPIYEPGLETIVKRNFEKERLHFTTNIEDAVKESEIIFIAVGTPEGEDGSADLKYVLQVAESIGKHMNGPKIVVDKSTVPVGTAKKVTAEIKKHTTHEFEVVSNPEFLKEGAAIDDFMKPDRVVVGVSSENAANKMRKLYAPFVRNNNPIYIMDVVSAEMTKYAANAMLATRISFMNEISSLCDKVGADVNQIRQGIGSDSRIGKSFLFPGIGYGGSCFPKDVKALIKTGEENGLELSVAKAVENVNYNQKRVMVRRIVDHFGEDLSGVTFGVWGLAFKPKTDDVREAPALVIVNELTKRGATLKLYDPEANETFSRALGEVKAVEFFDDNYSATKDVDALVICTEWNSFRQPDFGLLENNLKQKLIFDGRNIYNPEEMEQLGFTYYSIGRKAVKQN